MRERQVGERKEGSGRGGREVGEEVGEEEERRDSVR